MALQQHRKANKRTARKKKEKSASAAKNMPVSQEAAGHAPPAHGSFASQLLHDVAQDIKQEEKKQTKGNRGVWQAISLALLILFIGSLFYNPFNPRQNSEVEDDSQNSQLAAAGDDPPITLIVLNDATCTACDASPVIDVITSQVFPSTRVTEVDISSPEGKKMIEEYQIQALPAFLFDDKVAKAANFGRVSETLLKRGDSYLIHPAAVAIGKQVNPGKGTNPYFGKKDAPVTIIEFSDFQCPFSKMFFEQVYPQLKEEYIKTGKVKLYLRDFPLPIHPLAPSAAEAARCAGGQDKYWAMHDKIFKNQDALESDGLKKYAEELSLDMAAFNACLDSGTHQAAVQQDLADGTAMGVGGTPTFFINGIVITGAQPYEELKVVIDQELEKAGQ